MIKLTRILKSFHKNVIVKRKFKSYWLSFIDKEYRAQINNLYRLTNHSNKKEIRFVRTDLLVHGHKIIYPKYAESLVLNDRVELEPIKVVEHRGVFVVVDGNHRLPAIIARAKRHGTTFTKCEVVI